VRCPSCGEENPERAKFCLECATPLPAAAPAARLQERKVVTVLFCDLVGFTSASESADPEDVQARLSAYHSMLRTEIERYGGTVEKFIGDAVMAVFGAPTAHEDDAERAVRAGLRIAEAITELNEQQPGLDLQVRVGINTGEALVNLSAHPEHGEGFVTGDVVNTASRLQGAAPVDGVAVGQQTYGATKAVFDYVELEPAELKGKADKVPLFHAKAALSRFGTDLTRQHTTPLVGREIDLALLKGAFDKALSGPSLQLVTVVGEPGVGKSRLVTELFHHVDSLPDLVRFRQGRCLPYGDGITFWAIGEIVKAEAGVLDTDDPDTARQKLDQAVERLIEEPSERGWFADRLSPLLGLSAPSGSREETFTAWRRFLEAAAAENPTVCVLEDLHWADEALLDFIEHLAEWSEGVPLLVVCTARPELYEKHPDWGAGLRKGILIPLDPLSSAESARLVSALLGRAVLPVETQALLVERSGGNPLYAEEFVRMLSDRELIDEAGRLTVDPEELSFPSSVQAIIAARLDTLASDRKAVLQDAAVLGKVFWAGAVAALGDRVHSDVTADLHELSKKELIRGSRTSTVANEREYSFWHAFIRDVAYGGIPRATRATKHQAAAGWIEGMAGERVEEYAEILAHHYLTAAELAVATGSTDLGQLRSSARRQLLTAGIRAVLVDVPTAEKLLRAALDITPVEHEERPNVEAKLAIALKVAGKHEEATHLYHTAIAAFELRGDVAQRARAIVGLASIVNLHDPAEADRMIAEAIDILERLPPGPELMIALDTAAGRAMISSRHTDAIRLAGRLLRLLDQDVPVEMPRDLTRAHALHNRGMARFSQGDLGGLDDVRASITLAPNVGPYHNNLGQLLRVTEGAAAALSELEEAIRLATTRGARGAAVEAQETELDFYFDLGRCEEVLERAPGLITESCQMGDEYTQTVVEVWLARTQLLLGMVPDEHEIATWLEQARTLGDPQALLPALMVAASAAAARSNRADFGRLLGEVEPLYTAAGEALRPLYLPEITRLAIHHHNVPLAERLIDDTPPTYPASNAALASARAHTCEAIGDLEHAICHYFDAVERWSTLVHVVERAYAMLGLGRTRLATGDSSGVDDVSAARKIWVDLRAKPLIAEADRLLAGEQRLTS
jgi:class 3 adenylate cyclase/tetratricopeptide (TPR) repeat protein